MKLAVLGANGQLGADIVRAAARGGWTCVGLTHADVEIADRASVERALKAERPDAVVNTAAMHNVEQCEREPDRAHEVNALGAEHVAAAARSLGAAVVHVSTDYVFGGEKRTPYVETDAPAPVNVYGRSKLEGERRVAAATPRHFIMRVSALYGVDRCRAKTSDNFVRMMLSLASERGRVRVVTDEYVSPTWTRDVAGQLRVLLEREAYGLYHATSQGQCSWNEFARAIFADAGVDAVVEDAVSSDFPAKAPRPAYSVLDNAALRAGGLDIMPPWRDALRGYLEEIGELNAA